MSIAEYSRLLDVITTCRGTLELLALDWSIEETGQWQDLDLLIENLPKLTSFGLAWNGLSDFGISSFGDHLQELELIDSIPYHNAALDNKLGMALACTSNLKKLKVRSHRTLLNDAFTAVEANRTTLEEFYFCGSDISSELLGLSWKKVSVPNLRVLHLHTALCTFSAATSIPAVFPQLQFLGLRLTSDIGDTNSNLEFVLGRLQHLKGIHIQIFKGMRCESFSPKMNARDASYHEYNIIWPSLFPELRLAC